MTALDSLREKLATARQMPPPLDMVVLTADEAQAIVDQVEELARSGMDANINSTIFARACLSAPPHEGDDEHA